MRSLTGTWNGQYGYASIRKEPNVFVAGLVHEGEWLSGRIEEIAANGPLKGRSITAAVHGRVTGLRVTFLKIYDRQDGVHDTVSYAGQISPDGLEISGSWTIGRLSGPFLMVRPRGELAEVVRRQEAPV